MKALLLLLALQADDKATSKDPEIRHVTIAYDNVSLTAMLADLQKRTGIPIEMDAAARKAVDPDKTFFTSKIQDLPLYKVLHLLLRGHPLVIYSVDKRKLLISVEP